MLDPKNIPKIHQEEKLARYVFSKKHIRPGGSTVKPDAFVPYRHTKLSVTRHRDATKVEIWNIGENIALVREKELLGRADVQVFDFLEEKLNVIPDAIIPENPNHANVTGWPKEKSMQKIIAQEIAAKARFVPATEPR